MKNKPLKKHRGTSNIAAARETFFSTGNARLGAAFGKPSGIAVVLSH
jgi:hypothetical protein